MAADGRRRDRSGAWSVLSAARDGQDAVGGTESARQGGAGPHGGQTFRLLVTEATHAASNFGAANDVVDEAAAAGALPAGHGGEPEPRGDDDTPEQLAQAARIRAR